MTTLKKAVYYDTQTSDDIFKLKVKQRGHLLTLLSYLGEDNILVSSSTGNPLSIKGIQEVLHMVNKASAVHLMEQLSDAGICYSTVGEGFTVDPYYFASTVTDLVYDPAHTVIIDVDRIKESKAFNQMPVAAAGLLLSLYTFVSPIKYEDFLCDRDTFLPITQTDLVKAAHYTASRMSTNCDILSPAFIKKVAKAKGTYISISPKWAVHYLNQ